MRALTRFFQRSIRTITTRKQYAFFAYCSLQPRFERGKFLVDFHVEAMRAFE